MTNTSIILLPHAKLDPLIPFKPAFSVSYTLDSILSRQGVESSVCLKTYTSHAAHTLVRCEQH